MPEKKRGNRGYRRPKSENIGDYLRKKLAEKEYDFDQIAKLVRLDDNVVAPKTVVRELFENNSLPTYFGYFEKICEILDADNDVIKTWEEKDPAYLYAYWNWLRPDAPKIESIGILIRKYNQDYVNKGHTKQEIADGTDFKLSAISHAESLSQAVSYESFLKYASFYKKDPIEMMNEFYEDKELSDNISNLQTYIKNGRLLAEFSVEEAAEYVCFGNEEKYLKYENATTRYTVSDIQVLSECLGLSAQTLNELIQKCGLCFYKNTFSEASTSGLLPEGEKKITDLTDIIRRYKYVSDEEYKVESHSLLTLVYLALFSGESDRYKPEITYYLSHLMEEGNLPGGFIKDERISNGSCFDYFDLLRTEKNISCRNIGEALGKSNAYIINVCKGVKKADNKITNTPFNPSVICDISEYCGISPVVLMEGYMMQEEPVRDEASVWDVISTINRTIIWNMGGITVETNTLSSIVRTVFDRALSVKEKYATLKALSYHGVGEEAPEVVREEVPEKEAVKEPEKKVAKVMERVQDEESKSKDNDKNTVSTVYSEKEIKKDFKKKKKRALRIKIKSPKKEGGNSYSGGTSKIARGVGSPDSQRPGDMSKVGRSGPGFSIHSSNDEAKPFVKVGVAAVAGAPLSGDKNNEIKHVGVINPTETILTDKNKDATVSAKGLERIKGHKKRVAKVRIEKGEIVKSDEKLPDILRDRSGKPMAGPTKLADKTGLIKSPNSKEEKIGNSVKGKTTTE